MSDLRKILDDTIAALEDQKRTGVTHVAVSKETLAELGKPGYSGGLSQPALPESAVGRGGLTASRSPAAGANEWKQIEARVKACVKCAELSRCRKNVVFGVGNIQAELMFVGEAPGADEDEQGEPFVGRAGQLLTKIIEAMGYRRADIYIANVLKCRPPQNRMPLPDEMNNCRPYLLEQIDVIKPKVIVALGATAVRALLDVQIGITKMRGNWYTFHNTPIMPTFHPAYLLRNPPAKREVWEDMKTVLTKLGRPIPQTK